jgi:hypothetical protein
MILFFLYFLELPDKEFLVYETNDKGKMGTIELASERDSSGYHIIYTWDRVIDVILDSVDFGTLYIKKIVNDRLEMRISREDHFKVFFKGRYYVYEEDGPVYDRHTLDFALRGFDYTDEFKKTIRLHIPELMIVNAELEVIDESIISGPLGDIQCWNVQMTPRILFLRWKFFFWIEKEYPHRFIKYEDSSGKNSVLLIGYDG